MGMQVQGISVGMRGIWKEMKKNVGNLGGDGGWWGDGGNEGANLGTVVEITWYSNWNDKFKDGEKLK